MITIVVWRPQNRLRRSETTLLWGERTIGDGQTPLCFSHYLFAVPENSLS